MKIVIAGGGRLGRTLAAQLVAERHSVTVIDRSREVCERLFEDVGVVTIQGDTSDVRVLEQAAIHSADIAAGLLPRDAENLAFAMLTRSLSNARVMVRMLDDSYREAFILAGVRDVIAEAQLVVAKMTTAIEFPQLGGSLPLVGGEVVLFEITIASNAWVVNRTVGQLRADPEFPVDCVFVGFVDPEGNFELPAGSSVLRAGHTAVVASRREHLEKAVEYLGAAPTADAETRSMIESLRKVDFLEPLSDAELAELASELSLVRKEEGDHLFRRGDQGEEFFIVLSGEVVLTGIEGVEHAVGPGGFFGEISLLTGSPRSTDAKATRNCELLAIGREAFAQVVMANPTIALEMSRILGRRLARGARTVFEKGQPR
ncbi:NAD-binding protein [Vulgatibacter incomptus]|uniref:Trk system potassium uptake protein TrkA n=1 Tax=Vulgatibacter incomptus TaxID=1391653 RepID=A0A0K1PB37_9BACT|nr:NAD-binding protein [Vulgatibacter incomptus]AKU90702.1 cAMP-binding protein [Vulgatibacter incomptus]